MISANMRGMESYIGGVRGLVKAMETPGVQDGFLDKVMQEVKTQFVFDTTAANVGGNPTLKHVFEWGGTAGETSAVPLFRLNRGKIGRTKTMSYTFLPSTKRVPAPSDRYPIPNSVRRWLKPHIFPMKAWVMETQTRAEINPKSTKKILIPTNRSARGYVMSRGSVVNPGGEQATGGFAAWWNTWFDSKAEAIAKRESVQTEQILEKTGQRMVRWAAGTVMGGVKVGGRFAEQRALNFGYINGTERKWEGDVKRALDDWYGEGWMDD